MKRTYTRQSIFRLLVCLIVTSLLAVACGTSATEDPTAESETTPAELEATGDADEEVSDDLPEEVRQAAEEAAEHGLKFVTSREELERLAEEEGQVNAHWSLGDFTEGLTSLYEKHPWLEGNVEVSGLEGVEVRERLLLEMEAGALQGVDINYISTDVYSTFADYCDYDIYGMAEAGILDIPLEMIDPERRTTVASGTTSGVFVYNVDSFEDRELPASWEELVDPELYGPEAGFEMVIYIVSSNFVPLIPDWGLDQAIEYYQALDEDIQPTYAARMSPFVVSIAQGEQDAMPFTNLHTVQRRIADNPSVDYHIVEPVPVRLNHIHCVFNDEINSNPHAALLWLEWFANEGQALLETEEEPLQSHFASGIPGGVGELLEGRELAVLDWQYLEESESWIEELNRAIGFPQGQR